MTSRSERYALDIARATGHKSTAVLDGYIEQSGLFDDTPASKAGL